jgi:hypothetical protein
MIAALGPAIHAAHWLIVLIVMGAVIGAFGGSAARSSIGFARVGCFASLAGRHLALPTRQCGAPFEPCPFSVGRRIMRRENDYQ